VLRLLIISINYWPEETATGKYTGEMGRWFAGRGHAVDVIAGQPHYPAWKLMPGYRNRWQQEWHGGVRILRCPHTIPRPGRVGFTARVLMETSFAVSSLRWLTMVLTDRRNYDAAIVICPPLQTFALAELARIMRGWPWILHIQDLQVDAAERLGLLRSPLLAWLLPRIERFALRRATAASTISRAMVERVRAKQARACWLTPNWAETETIKPSPSANGVRAEMRATSDDVVFVYAGNLGEKQGIEWLAEVESLAAAPWHPLCDRR
jgi:colanic acid biosynthesis glycosyl transferase WcaI